MPGPNIARNESRRRADAIEWNYQPISVNGLGSTFRDELGNVQFQMDPLLSAMQGRLFMGGLSDLELSRGLASGVAREANNTRMRSGRLLDRAMGDPLRAAETRFSRLLDSFDRRNRGRRDALESRLLAQGRLGSTGGSRELGEFEAALQSEEAELFNDIYQQEQDYGLQAGALGNNLLGRSMEAQGGLFAQALQQGQMAPAMSAHTLALMNPAMAVSNADMNALIARSNAIMGHNQSMAGTAQQGFGDALLSGAATAAGAYFGGPLGAMAGNALANLFSGAGRPTPTPESRMI